MARWSMILALLVGCSGDGGPHECENGVATCDSSLIVNLPDPRTDFMLAVSDTQGMDLVIDCPAMDTGVASEGAYTWFCGQGRATINTWKPFGETVTVRLGSSPARDFTPSYSRGGDRCGNTCNTGIIDL